jgi:hypothetical protein
MAKLTKRITIFLATAILGTTLMGSAALAAVPTTDLATLNAVPIESAQTVSEDGTQPERDHHRRFCLRLNAVLTRLVEQGVITREQKQRILEAFNCLPSTTDRPATTDPRPSTTRTTTIRTTAAN